ncbi:MAG: ABC transporter permease [Fimbriimonadaceae bacterium]|nr:ABC transporter permease [Fimbriimonadaceae bacterium]
MQAANWLQRNLAVYIGNASAKRDFRAQLRGSRAIFLWGAYLLIMIGYALIMYAQVSRSSYYGGSMSVSETQGRLKEFYDQILYFLGAVVLLVAPGLTATTVATERQRRSLDLIFSAPVTPKYYLVGKMLSSYRYTWMLLILSLPITSVCVVMGGATWSEVLTSYLLLSLHALLLTAMSIVVSASVPKPVTAIMMSYLLTIVFAVGSTMLAAASVFAGGMRVSQEMAFTSQFSPFLVGYSADSYSYVFGRETPNWIITMLVTLLFTKILLLGGGSVLSTTGARETIGLRIHALIYIGLLGFSVGAWVTSSVSYPGALLGVAAGWTLMPLLLAVPTIASFGRDRERKYWNDGLISIRQTLTGARSGGLTFLLGLAFVGTVAYWMGLAQNGSAPSLMVGVPYLFWILAFWVFAWAVVRWLSATMRSAQSAQVLFIALFAILLCVPPIVLSSIDGNSIMDRMSIWSIWPFTPITGGRERPVLACVWGVGFLVISAALVMASERRVRRLRMISRPIEGPPPLIGA